MLLLIKSSVAALLLNTSRDEFILVKQFRPGMYSGASLQYIFSQMKVYSQ